MMLEFDEDKELYLYSLFGDLHSESHHPVCCFVMRVLAYKKIPYHNKVVTMQSEVSKMSKALRSLPVLKTGEEVMDNLLKIQHYVQENYPERSLIPRDRYQQAHCRMMLS